MSILIKPFEFELLLQPDTQVTVVKQPQVCHVAVEVIPVMRIQPQQPRFRPGVLTVIPVEIEDEPGNVLLSNRRNYGMRLVRIQLRYQKLAQ